MSADSPRHVRGGGPLTVPSQPPSDRSIIDAVSGFINDVTLSSSTAQDPKDVIQWARFETADINEPTPEGDSDNDISPLLLILGYGAGVQVWLIPPSGDAQEVLSWRQGTVKVLRILPSPQHGDCFASKRPLIALCDSASPGPAFCSLSFISVRGGEQVKSIKFKNPILDVLANKRSVVVSFSERFAVFDAATLEDRMTVTTCYPCPCPLGGSFPVNPLALGDRWLAYADKKLNQSKRSSGGCEGEGVTSYTATVLHAAKSLSKGLRGLGESVAHSLAGGGRSTSQSPSPPNADLQQPGVVTILDIEGNDDEDGQDSDEPYEPMVAHFVAHSEAIIALQFDASGMLLITADRRGHDFHVFRINPHPCGPTLAAVHHLYILHRGDTTAKVQDIAISWDSRWAAVSTLRGTTHVFAISAYGGAPCVRTHTQPRVVNRLSRFHRSAGLPIAHHAPHSHPQPVPKRNSASPVGDGLAQGAWFPNPRLPPYPIPIMLHPLAQLRPTANLPTHTITRTSSGRQRLSSLSEDSNTAPLLARCSFGMCMGSGGAAPVTALYLMAANGSLLHLVLHPRASHSIPKEKVCDESSIEVEVEAAAQWPLQRAGAAAADVLAPLPPSNPLLQPHANTGCADMCMSEEERWLSQVEIVTHAGPHRRLWMGPQFVFKTYNCTGSSSSLSEAETVEVEFHNVARSNPVNVPAARPIVPVLVDSGSASSLEQSPGGGCGRRSLAERAPACDLQLREDLAEAMREDHGRERAASEERPRWARACVARAVDPAGCVVAEPAARRAPPLEPDAYTRANDDEARFRPVVRAPAALAPASPVLARPLPRGTTIPVQTCVGGAPPDPGPALPLATHVLIPAALHPDRLPTLPNETPTESNAGDRTSCKLRDRDAGEVDIFNSSPTRDVESVVVKEVRESIVAKVIEGPKVQKEITDCNVEESNVSERSSDSNKGTSPRKDIREISVDREIRESKITKKDKKSSGVKKDRESSLLKEEKEINTSRKVREPSTSRESVSRSSAATEVEKSSVENIKASSDKKSRTPSATRETKKSNEPKENREPQTSKKSIECKEVKEPSLLRDSKQLKEISRDSATRETKKTNEPKENREPQTSEKSIECKEVKEPSLLRDSKQLKEISRDSATRETKKSNEPKENREPQTSKKSIECKEVKEPSLPRDSKQSKEISRDSATRETKKSNEPKENREPQTSKKSIECKEVKEPSLLRDSKQLKEISRDSATRETKKSNEPKENREPQTSEKSIECKEVKEPSLPRDSKQLKEIAHDSATRETKKSNEPNENREPQTSKKSIECKEVKEPSLPRDSKQLKEISREVRESKKIKEPKSKSENSKESDNKTDLEISGKQESVAVAKEDNIVSAPITLPVKSENSQGKRKDWQDRDIKTEEQAWDMLLNEPEKQVVANVSQQPIDSDKIAGESKPKSKKNRKTKKAQDDLQAKADEDSFVEIHAIEDKPQPCSGDLVAITPYEEIEPTSFYLFKTKKARSSKSPVSDKCDDLGEKSFNIPNKEVLQTMDHCISNTISNFEDISFDEEILADFNSPVKCIFTEDRQSKSEITQNEIANESTYLAAMKGSPKAKKSKSLSPYGEDRKTKDKFSEKDVKDVYVIDTIKDDFPEIQITRGKSRKRSPQPKPADNKSVTDVPVVKSWSSIAASKSVKKVEVEEKKEETVLKRESVCLRDELRDAAGILDVHTESSKVSLQDKLIELCKRTDIMVAECDEPSELNFVEEHHVLHDLPPLEPLDFGLDDFKLEVMRDSLLDVNDTKLTSPICKINIDDILSSIKETTSRVIESSTFNLIDLEKVPAKKEKGFSVIESHKITSQEVKLEEDSKSEEKDGEMMEKSSDDDTVSPVVTTDSDKEDKKGATASVVMPSSKQSTKSKKSRRKKK